MATQDKYDRQLRMWGSEGQSKLNKASILCLGISAVGTELLKNLVLPGIGEIKIVSDRLAEERDLGNNFFIDPQEVGQLYGAAVLANLLELNPDVKGSHVGLSPSNYLEAHKQDIAQHSLVVCDSLDFVDPFKRRISV